MGRRTTLNLVVAVVTAVLLAGAAGAQGFGPFGIPGAYRAELDLGALGEPRIEILYVILDANRSVLFTSEHEADKESPGVGAWRPIGGGQIALGAASFRYGPDPETSICGVVEVESPPGNCVLKVGGTVRRQGSGVLGGDLFLAIETTDGSTSVELPGALPIVMERLSASDFPGVP